MPAAIRRSLNRGGYQPSRFLDDYLRGVLAWRPRESGPGDLDLALNGTLRWTCDADYAIGAAPTNFLSGWLAGLRQWSRAAPCTVSKQPLYPAGSVCFQQFAVQAALPAQQRHLIPLRLGRSASLALVVHIFFADRRTAPARQV